MKFILLSFLTIFSIGTQASLFFTGMKPLQVKVVAKKVVDFQKSGLVEIHEPMFQAIGKNRHNASEFVPALAHDHNYSTPSLKKVDNELTAQFICTSLKYGKVVDVKNPKSLINFNRRFFHSLRVKNLKNPVSPKFFYHRYSQYGAIDVYRTVVCEKEIPDPFPGVDEDLES